MKAAAAYIIQADESTQKTLGALMPHMLDVSVSISSFIGIIISILSLNSLCLPLLLLVMIKLLLTALLY